MCVFSTRVCFGHFLTRPYENGCRFDRQHGDAAQSSALHSNRRGSVARLRLCWPKSEGPPSVSTTQISVRVDCACAVHLCPGVVCACACQPAVGIRHSSARKAASASNSCASLPAWPACSRYLCWRWLSRLLASAWTCPGVVEDGQLAASPSGSLYEQLTRRLSLRVSKSRSMLHHEK